MSENKNNFSVETETGEIVNPVYSSGFIMNKELFYEFCLVSYSRIKKMMFAFLFVCVGTMISYFLDGYYDTVIALGIFAVVVSSIFIYRIERATKISYERNLISAGKESNMQHELFEDKIVSHIDELKREYFYHQISKLYETKNFLLLHLKHNLFITINKNYLNASADQVKSFLMRKCSLVKKNKFINCSNDKKWALAFFVSLIVICIIGIVAGIVVLSLIKRDEVLYGN